MSIKLYRIYTENINLSDIKEEVSRFFDGYTLIDGNGYYRGDPEACLIIEILAGVTQIDDVLAVARAIRERNRQQEVLVSEQEVETWHIREAAIAQ